jgi:hypothetical protein
MALLNQSDISKPESHFFYQSRQRKPTLDRGRGVFLWDTDGKRKSVKSNAQQIKLIRTIVKNIGLEIATPAQERERLNLKGADKVNF